MSSTRSSPSDFSLFSLFTAGLACLVPLASAYTQPEGSAPTGNPIYTPGLHDVVPAGTPYNVTWDPTTSGTVTLVLLKGPSTNAVPQYAIVEKIENSGSYLWTPSTDLAPSSDGTGYGIELIVDSNGQYQYSTQFGISNADYSSSSSASSSWSSTWSTSTWATSTSTWSASGTPSASANSSSVTKISSIYPTASVSGTGAASTGAVPANSSVILPTGSMTVPSSLKTSATASGSSGASASSASASAAAVQTGAAGTLGTSLAGLVMAAGAVVIAL